MAAHNTMMQLLEKIDIFFPDETDMPTLQDLKNPTSGMVLKFLGRALYEFNIEADRWRMAHYSQSICSSYPENYMEIIPFINLYVIFRKIFQMAEMHVEFSMKDILQPRPSQNAKVMSAVMDFLIYADQKAIEIQPIFDEIRSKKKEEAQMELAKLEFQKKIKELMSKDVDQDRRKRQMTEKLESLRKKMEQNEETKEKMEKLKEIHIAQLQASEYGLSKAVKNEQQLNEEREKISSMVVDSPQHIISDIEKQRCKRVDSSKKLELLAQNIAQVKAQNSHLKSILDMVDVWSRKMKRAQELSTIISEMESKLNEESTHVESLERAHKELEKRHTNVVKKLEAAEQREKEVWDQNQEALQSLKLNVHGRKQSLKSLNKIMEESFITYKKLNADLTKVKDEQNKARVGFNQLMNLLNEKCEDIMHQDEKLCLKSVADAQERIAELKKIQDSKKTPAKENQKYK